MKIKVIVKYPGKKPHSTYISNTLKNLQNTVGGYIETVTVCSNFVIICNEEGKLLGLPYNCNICGMEFAGTIVFAGVKDDELCDIPCDYKAFKSMFASLFEEEQR